MSDASCASGQRLSARIGIIAAAAAALAIGTNASAQRRVDLPEGYITGVVESANGPEAGVWVIAETADLKTPFTKIVVTDDNGQYVLPELPEATYNVWVRGYGLVDSEPVEGRPGDRGLALDAVVAETRQEAARVYPANHWYAMFEPPPESEFPGTGPDGNGISPQMLTQKQWLNNQKSSCNFCHQIGNEITRTLDHMDHLGFESAEEAWGYRTQMGVRGTSMAGAFSAFGREAAMQRFADWTNRIEAGEVPDEPERPQGIERNVVVTLWDWGVDDSFMHDEITTDKNDPTVNAYGPVYAVSSGHGKLTVLDPIDNDTYELIVPTREDPREVNTRFPPPAVPSSFWGDTHLWGPEHPSDPHNPMLDRKGRVWMTSKIRNDQPEWCMEGSDHEYAQYYPLNRSFRQASYYDPDTEEFVLIDTCFSTHHLQFDNDPDQTLYFNELFGPIVGWINTREFDRTGDEQATQGWCPQILDTNGDGRITRPWNEWQGEFDPTLDSEVSYNLYSVIPSPVDSAVWGASESYPGHIVRVDPGTNPPETCMAEFYQVPDPGFDPRGIDIDSNGIVWAALAGSSHFARFDRSQCEVLNGPEMITGTHCEEGWTLFRTDGPTFQGTDVPSDFHYFGWVDQHNISGLGHDTPIATGSNSDALLALDPETSEWTTLRVPYPLGFFHRGLDGRIDDPSAGWKGRGLWANYGTHLIWHTEGGLGTLGKAVKFQIRPDPLAF